MLCCSCRTFQHLLNNQLISCALIMSLKSNQDVARFVLYLQTHHCSLAEGSHILVRLLSNLQHGWFVLTRTLLPCPPVCFFNSHHCALFLYLLSSLITKIGLMYFFCTLLFVCYTLNHVFIFLKILYIYF